MAGGVNMHGVGDATSNESARGRHVSAVTSYGVASDAPAE